MTILTRNRLKWLSLSLSVGVGLVLTGCAGGAGGNEGGTGEGVEYGTTKEGYAAALEDMEPVELTYQPASPSADTPTGRKEQAFADAIEDVSDGKITVTMAWGTPIAGLDTAADALADGRLDIAYHVPVYSPTEYPGISQLEYLGPTMEPSPYMGGMINQVAMNAVAFEFEEIRDDYESMGLGLLIPTDTEYDNGIVCTEPLESADDFQGLQVRVGSTVDRVILEDLGSSPVTLAATELYEGLQRGVVDCMQAHIKNASIYGTMEVAPHFAFPSENSFTRSPGSVLTGINVQALPLAAQQLIFDQVPHLLAGQVTEYLEYIKEAGPQIREYGGSVTTLPAEVEDSIGQSAKSLRSEARATEHFDGEAVVAEYDEAVEKWSETAETLGYEHHGDTLLELSDYLEDDEIDPQPFVDAYFEEVFVPHRPS